VAEDGEVDGAAVGVGDGNAFHAQRGQPLLTQSGYEIFVLLFVVIQSQVTLNYRPG
jgi:hypothetical protein